MEELIDCGLGSGKWEMSKKVFSTDGF